MIKRLGKKITIYLLIAIFILPLLSVGLMAQPVHAADAWYNLSWDYRVKITFTASAMSENLTDFPVMIYLEDDVEIDFAHAQDDGDDIRFTDSDGETLLKYELEYWTDDDSAVFWVKVPQLDDSDTDYIYMYYGNDSVGSGEDAENVWESNFRMVQHLTDATTSTTLDSTSNNNDGSKTAANEPVEAAGLIYKGQDCDGSNDRWYANDAASLKVGTGDCTWEIWVKTTQSAGAGVYPIYFAKDDEQAVRYGWFIYQAASANDVQVGFQYGGAEKNVDTNTTVNNGAWHYVVGVKTSSAVIAYIDGVYIGETAYTGALNTDKAVPVEIGNKAGMGSRASSGVFDEARFSAAARSASWVKATYLSGTNTLCSYGSEESNPSPSITTNAVSDIDYTTATANANITAVNDTNITYRGFVWDDSSHGSPGNIAPGSSDYSYYWTESGTFGTGAYTHSLTSLIPATTYYVRGCAYNDAGVWGYGGEVYFDTLSPDVPTVSSGNCLGFTHTSATVEGTVSSLGGASSVSQVGFDYGATDAYGSEYIVAANVTSVPSDFTLTIPDLSPGSVYHYRAKAYNTSGWGYGSDAYFSTQGSPTVWEYLNTGDDGWGADIYGNNWACMQFTTGSTAHTITSIRLYIERTGSPGTVTLSVKYADGSNFPTGNALWTGTYNGNNFSTDYSWYDFTDDDGDVLSLEASEEYCLEVKALSGDVSNYVEWRWDAGGSLANAVAGHSTNGGTSWTSDTPADFLFEVWGETTLSVEDAAVFNDYSEDGDMLFVAYVINTYPPYYRTGLASQYFQVQLLDTGGSTILATTTLKSWGARPIGIYVGESLADSLSQGAAYYIRMIGSFSGTPSVQYQLQSDDWKGDDLNYLDEWCITTAYQMEEHDGAEIPYTSYSLEYGELLSVGIGSIFTEGIPLLGKIRPELFAVNVLTPEYGFGDGSEGETFYNAADWEAQVGSDIATDADEIATLFGLDSGQTALGILAGLAWIALMVLGITQGGSGIWYLVLASPCLYAASHFRVINIQMVMAMALIMIVVFVWKTIWTKT